MKGNPRRIVHTITFRPGSDYVRKVEAQKYWPPARTPSPKKQVGSRQVNKHELKQDIQYLCNIYRQQFGDIQVQFGQSQPQRSSKGQLHINDLQAQQTVKPRSPYDGLKQRVECVGETMEFLGAYSSKLGEMMEDLTTTTMALKQSMDKLNISEAKWRKLDKTRN